MQGLRQDCTVQHLRNELTVQIYEAAARAALQYGDHAEYNQCQTQLNALFQEGQPGSRAEFLAYRLLYQTVHAAQGELVALVSAMKLASCQVCNLLPPLPLPTLSSPLDTHTHVSACPHPACAACSRSTSAFDRLPVYGLLTPVEKDHYKGGPPLHSSYLVRMWPMQ